MPIKRLFISLLFSGLLISNTSHAGHAGMMELTYRQVSGTSYEFTMIFYRACGGASAPFSVALRAQSTSLSVNTNALTMTQLPSTGPGLPPLSPQNMFNCTSLSMCWEEYIYRGTLNLATLSPTPYADDWIFSYELCCYPAGAISPDNIGTGSIYAVCGLNNLDFPAGNDAPIWHDRRPSRPGHTLDTVINYPGTAVCAGFPVEIDQSVEEYEGDRVRYEFITPLSAGGASASYIGGYSLTNPLPFATPPGFDFDTASGIMSFVGANSTDNVFYLGLKAVELRLDTDTILGVPTPTYKEIGFIYRNFILVLESSATCPDKSIDLKKNKLNLSCSDSAFAVETSEKFQCSTADYDASFVLIREQITGDTISLDSAVVISCAANDVAKSFMVHLSAPLPAGKYNLVLQPGTDTNTVVSECGNEIPPYVDTIFITVDTINIPEVITSLDSNGQELNYFKANCGSSTIGFNLTDPILCNSIDTSGSEFTLIDSTTTPPGTLTISSVVLENCKKGLVDSITIHLQSPFEEGKYELIIQNGLDANTFLNECGEESLPTSFSIIAPDVDIELGPDLFYCKDSVFYAVIGPTSGFDSYDWSTGQSDPQIVVTKKGTYILEVDNGFGCTALDTVIVTEIDCSTGIENSALSSIEIYPIPANEEVQIVVKEELNLTIQLFNQLGAEVSEDSYQLTRSGNTYLMNTQKLNSGVYVLRIESSTGNAMNKRVIIQH